jgi:hypothetical protein
MIKGFIMTRCEEIKKSLEIGSTEQQVLRSIGWFYHNKYQPDLDKAFKCLIDLGIEKVVVDKKNIYICLERPGLLIGMKGENIDALQAFLLNDGFKQKIAIIESRRDVKEFLTSWTYAYYDGY